MCVREKEERGRNPPYWITAIICEKEKHENRMV